MHGLNIASTIFLYFYVRRYLINFYMKYFKFLVFDIVCL